MTYRLINNPQKVPWLAILCKIDPSPVKGIDYLKGATRQRVKENEMAQEASPSFQKIEAQVKAITATKHMKEISLVIKLLNAYIAGFRPQNLYRLVY